MAAYSHLCEPTRPIRLRMRFREQALSFQHVDQFVPLVIVVLCLTVFTVMISSFVLFTSPWERFASPFIAVSIACKLRSLMTCMLSKRRARILLVFVDPNWAPKEPVLLAALIRTIYNLKFWLTVFLSGS